MKKDSALRVIIADDHQLIREAIKLYVSELAPEVVVAEAGDYQQLAELCRASGTDTPHIILLDLEMPGRDVDPCADLRQLCGELPNTSIVVLSADSRKATISCAFRCGVQGYIPKTTTGRSLIAALRLILAGELYVPPEAIGDDQFNNATMSANSGQPILTASEIVIMKLLAQGLSNKAIANELSLQEVTVKMHLRNSFRKLGAQNRVDAVRRVLESGALN